MDVAFGFLWATFLCLYFIYLLTFCVSKRLPGSVREERYTIGKSALQHEGRQNSQSWAHKLHWCGIIRPFAFGASLPPVFSSSSLSYPELTPNCTQLFFFPRPLSFMLCVCFFFSFLAVVLLWLHFNPILLLCLFLVSAAAQCFGSQSARTADWRVSGCSLPDLISS